MRRKGSLLGFMILATLLFGASSAHAAFPGQNGKIVFQGVEPEPGNFHGDLFAVNPDGTGLQNLTNDDESDSRPAWSADGSKIAWDVNRQIWTMNADGTNRAQVPIAVNAQAPTWSPDGTMIAFEHGPYSGTPIYVMNVDGTGMRPVTDPTDFCVRYRNPSWSPDGSKIVFDRAQLEESCMEELGTPHEIWVVNADGTDLKMLSQGRNPTWSPDGTKIVSDGLFVMNADGADRQILGGSFNGGRAAAWSPDGTRIAFENSSQDRGNNPDVYIVNADGSGDETRLTGSPTGGHNPDWQPLPGPQRTDFRNANKFCKAERDFLGTEAFSRKYATNRRGTNGFSRCVRANRG